MSIDYDHNTEFKKMVNKFGIKPNYAYLTTKLKETIPFGEILSIIYYIEPQTMEFEGSQLHRITAYLMKNFKPQQEYTK